MLQTMTQMKVVQMKVVFPCWPIPGLIKIPGTPQAVDQRNTQDSFKYELTAPCRGGRKQRPHVVNASEPVLVTRVNDDGTEQEVKAVRVQINHGVKEELFYPADSFGKLQ